MIRGEYILSFAEQLALKADMYGDELNIDREMTSVKKKMEDYFQERMHTIDLIKPKSTMAIGGITINYSNFFIPKKVSPLHYRQLFVDELHKLGFVDKNISFEFKEYPSADYYRIIVRW